MQSGTFAVMGFWDRPRMDQIWADAVKELGLENSEDALREMRELPWQRLLSVKSLDVSPMSQTDVSAEDLTDWQMDGYGVFTDDYFVSPPFFSPNGAFLDYQPTVVDAVMHGDNADEGNIFRDAAARPGAFEDLKRVAKELMGEQGLNELLHIYGLNDEDVQRIDKPELACRLHRIPEDARFYLPSDELLRVWPKAAFYHLTARSPFRKTSVWPNDSYHTLDLLYVSCLL